MRGRPVRMAVLLCVLPASLALAQTELISYQNYASFPAFSHKVQALAYNSDGTQLAVGGEDASVVLYDVQQRRVITTLPHGGKRVVGLAFRGDGSFLAAATESRTVTVWDLKTNQARQLTGHAGPVLAVAFSPSDDLLASAGADREIILWSLNLGREVGRLRGGHSKEITFLAFLGRGETLVSVGKDRQIVHWDVKAKTRLRQLLEPDSFIPSITTSPGAELLILGTEETTVPGYRGGLGAGRMGLIYIDRLKLYNMQTGLAEKVIENLIAEPVSVSLSADYNYVAVAQRDTKRTYVGLWDVQRAVQVANVPVTGKITTVHFSPNGKWLAYGDEKGEVNVLEVKGVYPKATYTVELRGQKYVITSPREPLVKPSARLHFALLDLDNLGVEADVSRAISDQLNNRLATNPAVNLVERRRIQALLKEQEFQHTGRTDPSMAVQLARVLNVQKLVMGSLSRLGTTMTITTSLVDVETGRIDGVREIQCRKCELEDLTESVGRLAETLVAPPGAAPLAAPAAAPKVEILELADGAEVATDKLRFRAVARHAQGLKGIELVVNGKPLPATAGVNLVSGSKLTPTPGGRTEFTVDQQVDLKPGNNVIAVRAVAEDGSDEQRYVFVRRPSEAGGPAGARALGKKWAVIVGVSKYKDPGVPAMDFADRDGQSLAEFIQTPQGGGYARDNVLLLTNEQATAANLKGALRGFLQKPEADDVVMLYLGLHGVPDPSQLENVYFLPYDADTSNLPGSAISMRDIELTLRYTVLAQRVVILLDACRWRMEVAGRINQAFQDAIRNATPGVAVFTAAMAGETSQSGLQWGGGHGVFAWHLLEGMRGRADRNQDGVVTLEDVFEYVREHVRRDTQDRQHPQVLSTSHDPSLRLAVLRPPAP